VPRLVRLVGVHRQSVGTVRSLLFIALVGAHAALSLSRAVSIIDGYSAPVRLLTHDNTTTHWQRLDKASATVCIGKDWYRFPSHFFLPEQ
jgi:alpha-1,2-mannosyltransferase